MTAAGQQRSSGARVAIVVVALLALMAVPLAQAARHRTSHRSRGHHRHLRHHRRMHTSTPGPAGPSPSSPGGPAGHPHVLLVGSYHGVPGDYGSIQDAVDAAQPGDWVLVGPGDYHETGHRVPPGAKGDDRAGAAVLISKPGLHLRGMDRNGVMVDGTKPGAPKCSSAESDQDLGPNGPSGKPVGRNGVLVFKSDGVSVENLSACNFLTGDTGGGNVIWFDGGGATGAQALGPFRGAYLSATSTFYKDGDSPASSYGVYVSNTYGPGIFEHDYASNMGDASYYVGACPDCNTTLNDVHGQYSDLGYSGTNSGGHLTVVNSEFDNNQSGFVTNSQNNDDAPSPQDGACPNGGAGPQPAGTQRSTACWVFAQNYVHDNNNPNVPTTGTAAAGPVGSGVVVAGGRRDIITANRVANNGSWGVLLVPFPDTGTPPDVANCNGGTGQSFNGQSACYFDDYANEVAGNTFSNNGFFGNATNGDLADISNPNPDANCWHDNVRADGSPASSDPATLQSTNARCGQPGSGNSLASPLGAQVACDSQLLGPCPSNTAANYPRATQVTMQPLPAQPSMANACLGVPANPWCAAVPSGAGSSPGTPGPRTSSKRRHARHHRRHHRVAKRHARRAHRRAG